MTQADNAACGQTQPPETVHITSSRTSCDGGKLGHPRIYLETGEKEYVDCPYCGKRFIRVKAA